MTTAVVSRISKLRRRQDEFLQDAADRWQRSPEDQRAAGNIARDVYARTDEPAEALRRAEFLEAFADRMPIRVEAEELIVGSMSFGVFREQRPADLPADAPWFEGNGGHVVVDYGRVLDLGVCGLRADIARMPKGTEQQRQNKQAFGRALEAFSVFVRRHAELAGVEGMEQVAANCTHVVESAPQTFWQALQLTWFMHVFLHAESSSAAISFGRLDRFLWPFLERDLADGEITMAQAEELIACLWLRCCEGDESQNVVVGGCDSDGNAAENPLSLLCLKVMRDLRVWQPSLSVRIGPHTSEQFWAEALRLCAAGFGMPSFFNDPVVIDSVVAAGIPIERARDWGIVGCYEATPQGDCLARTVHGHWVLPNMFLAYMEARCAPADAPATFAEFKDGLRAFMAADYARLLPQFQARWNRMRDLQASPFRSLCMPGCCESGLCAEEAGTRFNLYGVDTLGLGTLIDSLWGVQRLVYDTAQLSLAELRQQIENDFPDEELLAQCRNLPGKYGSDSPETNALADELANHVADLVLGSPMEHGVQPFPALFIFTGWAQMKIAATPDGRRNGEPVSYGVGPSVYCNGKTPTSVLNSAALAANDRCGCGNPMFLTLNQSDIHGEAGHLRIRQMVETYFREGGFHLHMNILDADQLREAKASPTQHTDLLVRISGLSAQFVALDERLQDGLIARAEQGL